jgi:uncharacterized protein YecE (DUF72 family)
MSQQAPLLIGTAGWSYPDWNDLVYPRAEKNKLAWMARYFDCIEINSSFYRPFNARTGEKWLRDVEANERFQFTAKLWRRFTHETDEAFTGEEVKAAKEGFSILKDAGKLAGVLLQFPFFFRDSEQTRDLLKRIAEGFAEYPKVLEVRDASWSEPEAVEFITGLNLNLACLDMPLTKSAYKEWSRVTGPIGYLRLHGRNREAWFGKDAGRDDRYNYLYSDKELDQIIERAEEMRRVAQLVVLIWNNHFRGKAAVNAFQTIHRILGKKVTVPESLAREYPELRGVMRSE